MAFDKKSVEKAVEQALAQKSERKFTQSVDLAINFKELDFKKPENRVNTDIALPNAARQVKVAVFADGQLALDAKNVADAVFGAADITAFASDKKKQAELLKYSLLAAPQFMAVIGKQLGQVLGTKGKLPTPILPGINLAELVKKTRASITLKVKGKMLPCLHCIVGRENMPKEQIVENVMAVLEVVIKKVSEPRVASAYVKTTMGKPVKV
ncbi:TPA: 50S ribosomal protein L1 [Candidatus Micrarchaeota archaeon]|nr:MAG: hypothetical protein AUJ65_02060 [Candidatus Micrarchaeota archaeon CG1_02_51_15]HII38765.1 50S ribosomal protein L1 [Candidatus Micrarchaeota archaeon]